MGKSILKNSLKIILCAIVFLVLVQGVQAEVNYIVMVNEPVNLGFIHTHLENGLPFVGYVSELVKWNGISWETSPVIGSNITDSEGRVHFIITEKNPGTYYYKNHLQSVSDSWSGVVTVNVYDSPVVANIKSCSIIISPGYYSLVNDIRTTASGNCINIRSSSVLFDGMGHTIQGTIIDDSTMANGILVQHPPEVENVKLTNINIRNVTLENWSHGIYLHNTGGKISHTNAYGNYFDGIWVEKSGNLIIENNTASNGIYRGIGIVDSGTILVINNTATGNLGKDGKGGFGIRLDNSSLITVKNNFFLQNHGSGAILLNASHNTLLGNKVNNNDINGIVLITSTENNVTHNKIANNGNYGISLQSSGQNSFSDNFLNNSQNINSDSSNVWNVTRRTGVNSMGGLTIGGNYWAKPDGTGFSQTCTDLTHDGICDSIYSIDTVNFDYLPLSSFALLPLPGYTNPPTDPDNDGIYEDLNGNGRLDFADVVLYFNQMEWIAANEPVSAFDLNGNGRIDFADIVRLFGEI